MVVTTLWLVKAQSFYFTHKWNFLGANFLQVLNPGGTAVANAISCPLILSAGQSMRKLYSNYVATQKNYIYILHLINISMCLPQFTTECPY